MAAEPYIVLLPDQDEMPARNLVNGIEGFVVVAGSTADAVALCQSQFDSDGTVWDSATTTQVVADANLHGFILVITITKPTDNTVTGSVTVTADSMEDPGVKATGSVNDTAGVPSDGDQFDIGGTTYTFKTSLTPAAHEVLIGGSAVNAIAHLVQAITYDNGAGTHAGTNYVGTTADPNVTAVVDVTTTIADITALVAGTAGNSLILTAPTNVSTHLAVSGGTLTGGENVDSIDTLANAAVTALNAGGFGVTNASYNASTNVLTAAGTSDNLGDHLLTVQMFPPDYVAPVPIRGMIGTITDEGSAGAALTVALCADNYVIPLGAAGFRAVKLYESGGSGAGAYVISPGGADGAKEGVTYWDGVDTAVVYADTAADANDIAGAIYGNTMGALWAAATPIKAVAGADLTGWQFNVSIIDPTSGVTVVDQTYTGVASDTFDLAATAMAVLLNADPSGLVANAAYNSSTNVLTAAGTADNLGDHELAVGWYPPGAETTQYPIPGFTGAITDLGSSGSALTVALAADSYTVPAVVAAVARS